MLKKVVNGDVHEVFVEGSLGETSDLFKYRAEGAKTLIVDLSQATYINSVGVKTWILWTVKLPATCTLHLRNCPLLFVNQVNTVVGFVPSTAVLDSIQLPWICPKCSSTQSILLSHGKDYEYSQAGKGPVFRLPKRVDCGKCRLEMEPDFMQVKVFSFLLRKLDPVNLFAAATRQSVGDLPRRSSFDTPRATRPGRPIQPAPAQSLPLEPSSDLQSPQDL